MSLSLAVRLSIMMFLQFAVWGAWLPVAGGYFQQDLGFTGAQIGWLFALMPLMCIIAPFIGGQMADRYVPTQVFLGAAHIIGGICMLFIAPASTFVAIVILLGAWAFFYAPTLALVNSISFHHLENVERDFGKIRCWGSVGWIAVGLVATMWLSTAKFADRSADTPLEVSAAQTTQVTAAQDGETSASRSADEGLLSRILAGPAESLHSLASSVLGRNPNPQLRDIFTIGGCASILLGLFCFFLPHTPPDKKGEDPWAFLKALKLCRDWHFMVFLAVSFTVSALLMFLFLWQFPFFKHVGVSEANIPFVLTLEQASEFVVTMAILPILLPRFGARTALFIGICSWPILFGVFAIGNAPMAVKVAALALHGIGYALFFTVSFIYVDSVADKESRASAQALQAVVLFGLGPFIGSKFAGWTKDFYTNGDEVAWTPIFLIPCIVLAACAVAFLLFFKDPEQKTPEQEQTAA